MHSQNIPFRLNNTPPDELKEKDEVPPRFFCNLMSETNETSVLGHYPRRPSGCTRCQCEEKEFK